MKYEGHYEVIVTNVHGLHEPHSIRFVTKPTWFKRVCAKLAGFNWCDKPVEMYPPVRKTPLRKKTAATV